MNPDYAQRRRVAVALAITVIAVPAVALLSRGGDTATDPPPTVVGTVAPEGAVAATTPPTGASGPAATDVMGTPPVAYLEGSERADDGDPARIAIPRVDQAQTGTASFSHSITRVSQCQVVGVPYNAAVTVTNLDNSRSVQCFAAVGGPSPDDDVVLHADAFSQIADLTDAPIPVRITW